MGNQHSRPRNKVFHIGTLNFSGICLSPFQYHDCSVEKDFMSSKFQEVMKSYTKDEHGKVDEGFKWDVGKIDQKLQKERYTPVYNKEVGVDHESLVDKSEFDALWDKSFQKHRGLLEKDKPSQAQVDQAKLFDWICYETFLNVVYNKTPKQRFDLKTVRQQDPKPYKEFLKEWHSKSYLDNSKKMKKVGELLKSKDLDILCMQEADVKEKTTWAQVVGEEFEVIEKANCGGVIILRKSKFKGDSQNKPKKQDEQFEKRYLRDLDKDDPLNQKEDRMNLNFNGDTIIAKRGKYLVISGHLSSKEDKHVKQAPAMFKILTKIQQNENVYVIMGLDSNHFMSPKDYPRYNIHPAVATESTSTKKRTAIQLQTKKTNLIVMETKDQIVSDLNILESHVTMINGSETSDKTYLPSDEHPFDHFLVWGVIETEVDYKKKHEEQIVELQKMKKQHQAEIGELRRSSK